MGWKSKTSTSAESEVTFNAAGNGVSEAPKGAMIDRKSMEEYKQQFEHHRLHNKHATESEILHRVKEYIKKKIDGIVDEACRKRIMDLTTVTVSVFSSTLIPFSGVAVVVAATVMQCLNFSVTLGLIPLLNVRSINDLVAMSTQIGNTIKRASKSSLMAGVETAVLEILKTGGVGDWLWTEILRDILVDMIGDAAMDSTWILTPLFAAPKYMMHRHLIKKMYRKLGDKAHVVHHTWTEQNCVQRANSTAAVGAAQTTVAAGAVQVDAYGNVQGAYFEMSSTQVQNGAAGAQVQVAQTNAYFQQQTPQQWPAYPPSSQATPAGMVPGYPQVPVQPGPNSNPSFIQPQPQPAANKPSATLIMGYTPPANSSHFQPQAQQGTGTLIMGHTAPANSSFFQPQSGGSFQSQTCTPQTGPYGPQQMRPMYPPQGQPQGNPYIQMGDYNKVQAPASSLFDAPGQPHFSPYGPAQEHHKMQAPLQYPPAGNQQAYPPQGGYQAAAAPPPDLWYQPQAN